MFRLATQWAACCSSWRYVLVLSSILPLSVGALAVCPGCWHNIMIQGSFHGLGSFHTGVHAYFTPAVWSSPPACQYILPTTVPDQLFVLFCLLQGAAPQQFYLLHAGQQLDVCRTLADYSIQHQDTLELQLRIRCGHQTQASPPGTGNIVAAASCALLAD